MEQSEPQTLTVPAEAVPAVLYAIERARDDLEARAIVAEQHGDRRGRDSAGEYRDDARQLGQLLTQLGLQVQPPEPQREAVRWLDGVYAIDDERQPQPLVPKPDLQRLLDQAVERRHDGKVHVGDVLEALSAATGQPQLEVLRRTAATRTQHDRSQPQACQQDRDLDQTTSRQQDRDLDLDPPA